MCHGCLEALKSLVEQLFGSSAEYGVVELEGGKLEPVSQSEEEDNWDQESWGDGEESASDGWDNRSKEERGRIESEEDVQKELELELGQVSLSPPSTPPSSVPVEKLAPPPETKAMGDFNKISSRVEDGAASEGLKEVDLFSSLGMESSKDLSKLASTKRVQQKQPEGASPSSLTEVAMSAYDEQALNDWLEEDDDLDLDAYLDS